MAATVSIQVRLLGRFVVLRAGQEVPPAAFGGRKVRQLVRVLATRVGRYTSRDVLVDALWPGQLPADPSANLSVLVNRARRALCDPDSIATEPAGYQLTAVCEVDAELFAASVRSARSSARAADGRSALQRYVTALESWNGEPLQEDGDVEWANAYRRRLLLLHQEALEEASLLAVEHEEATLAVSFAQAAVEGDPLRETAYLTLARAQAASEDRAAALDTLRRLRRRFVDELGLEPSPQAQQLQADILSGAQAASPGRRPTGRTARFGAASREQAGRPAVSRPLPLLGRADQLTALAAATEARPGATGPAGAVAGVALLAGEAGAGKSRLVSEFADSRRDVVTARAFLPERSQPWALARTLLRELLARDSGLMDVLGPRSVAALAEVLPEIADQAGPVEPGSLDPRSWRALVLEAGLSVLAAARVRLLVVDDAQWVDPSSAAMLATAVERHPELGAVLAYRPEEVPPGGHVQELLDLVGAHRPVQVVTLPPLGAADLSAVLDPALARTVCDSTDGSPFAVVSVVQALVRSHHLLADDTGRWRVELPGSMDLAQELGRRGRRRMIHAQVARHDRLSRDLLGLLSLLAREAPAQTLAAASGGSHAEVLECLTRLSAAGLVRLGERGWATAHDLVRETVADDLSSAERGRLHGLLAPALEEAGADPAELALHLAGAGAADAAARCYLRAAQALLDSPADAQAEHFAGLGLALSERPETTRGLLEARAQVRARHGDLSGAGDDLQQALAGAARGTERARLLGRLAMHYSGARDPARAAELAELAILEAGSDDLARAAALEVAAILDMNLGRARRSAERAELALDLYVRSGDSYGAARIMDGRAMAVFLDGDISQAITLFRRVTDLFTDSGQLLAVITPQSTLGHALVFHDRAAAGLEQTEAALELARTLGSQEGQTYALWHRSEALTATGRIDEAVGNAELALEIAERIGHRGWTATSLRALGIACSAGGDLTRALAAFTRSYELSENLSLFRSWASARRALTLLALGRVDAAAPLVDLAIAGGPGLARYEARLAQAELAAARHDPDRHERALIALEEALDGGHLASAVRLRQLAQR